MVRVHEVTSTFSKTLERKGIRVIVYIDDGICAAKSKAQSLIHRDMVVSDLKLSGFVLNVQKSCLEPQQIGKWLGFNLDLLEGKFMFLMINWPASNLLLGMLSPLPESPSNAWLK